MMLNNRIFTLSDFKVAKAIKGDIKAGDIIKVKQDWISNGTEFFKSGERHLLFLKSFAEDNYKTPLSPINPPQGSVRIIQITNSPSSILK